MDTTIFETQKLLLSMFRDFVKFLEENNYNYFCAYGTALGAVRHNNIIPWDDDIDIHMPREDYDRLIVSGLNADMKDYGIVSTLCQGYYMPYAKIYNKNTTIIEKKRFDYPIGLYIDIFPIDCYGGSKEKFVKDYKHVHYIKDLYRCSISHYSIEEMRMDFSRKDYGGIVKGIFSCLLPKFTSKYFSKAARKFRISITDKHGRAAISLYGDYGEKEFFNTSWFANYKIYPFADFKVRVPGNVEAYLTHLYGDYMQLPPENKRFSEHVYYYVNYTKPVKTMG